MPDSSYESMMLDSRSKVAELEAELERLRALLKRLVSWHPLPDMPNLNSTLVEAREELNRG